MGRKKKSDETVAVFSVPKAGVPPTPPVSELQPDRIRTLLNKPPTVKGKLPLWEAKWSSLALKDKLADLGQREFDRSYRQYPISEQDLLWKREWIDRALDRRVVLPTVVQPGNFWYPMRRFAGMDLAISDNITEAAFFCLSTIGVTTDGLRWVMGMERHRGISLNAQFELLARTYSNLGFEVCGVENNGIQAAIEGYVREITNIPTRPIHTGALQKNDVIVGVPSLATEFEQGRWRIPYGDARSRNLMDPLLEEMYAYPSPGSFTDTIMSLYFSIRMFRDTARGLHSIITIAY